jgi:hypothetical protein
VHDLQGQGVAARDENERSRVLMAKVISEKISPGVPILVRRLPPRRWGADLPPAGGGEVGGSLASRRGAGEAAVHAVPPSNLPPLGGGKSRVHIAVDHHEGGSFSEIA